MSASGSWGARSISRITSLTTRSTATSPAPAPVQSIDDLENMEMPVELSNSIRSFLSNLSNPVHKAPFSPERLMNMFQDFYSGMEELVQDSLPVDSGSVNNNSEELISTEEMAELKDRRSKAEAKRQLWREEIEERVCLEMYDKIFELKTSNDELRDEALMSKIIAMNLIGVSLEQLGVGLSEKDWKEMQPTIALIGEELQSLNNAVSPKAKIDLLVTCHKQIVAEVQQTNVADDLANLIENRDEEGGASSPEKNQATVPEDRTRLSADAILPIFIYSIIKSNPAKLVSHFQYIQRFRTATLLTGEAAYCLTNLEAAIGFLETFDDGSTKDYDPLRAGVLDTSLKASNSTTSLSSSLRASERARALSSAAQDVYEFADERMKSLGAQFGSQLGALVNRVGQAQDIEDVRSMLGLADDSPALRSLSKYRASTDQMNPEQRLITSQSRNTVESVKSSANTVNSQHTRGGNRFGSLSGLGMIRNFSSSFAASRPMDGSQMSGRALQPLIVETSDDSDHEKPRSSSASAGPPNVSFNKRFLQMQADDLTLRDVRELLTEYKRLSKVLA